MDVELVVFEKFLDEADLFRGMIYNLEIVSKRAGPQLLPLRQFLFEGTGLLGKRRYFGLQEQLSQGFSDTVDLFLLLDSSQYTSFLHSNISLFYYYLRGFTLFRYYETG